MVEPQENSGIKTFANMGLSAVGSISAFGGAATLFNNELMPAGVLLLASALAFGLLAMSNR